jgi:hypothetical protein
MHQDRGACVGIENVKDQHFELDLKSCALLTRSPKASSEYPNQRL